MRFRNCIILGICALSVVSLSSCGKGDGSVKAERNAIKSGNKLYNKGDYAGAVKDYDEALASNMSSEVAMYNKAMAIINDYHSGGKIDSLQLVTARQALSTLSLNTTNTNLADKAAYNLGNDSFYMGRHFKDAAKSDPSQAQRYDSLAIACYKQSIEQYKMLLRRRPDNQKALQNMRIAQLQLPKGGDDNNNNQNQQQQQQPQPQPQPQPQNSNEEQIMRSVQQKENQTRKNNEQKAQPSASYSTDKPW